MKILDARLGAIALGCLVLSGLACFTTGRGYVGGVGVAYTGDYYQSQETVYGGWQPGYHVAPPRGSYRHVGPAVKPHKYRPAAPSLRLPSLPKRLPRP
jgi:hypothetical protein